MANKHTDETTNEAAIETTSTLDKLKIDYSATVAEVGCEGDVLRRFLDLGLIRGTPITALYRAPSGEPTAYFFRGTVIALRKDDTRNITISVYGGKGHEKEC